MGEAGGNQKQFNQNQISTAFNCKEVIQGARLKIIREKTHTLWKISIGLNFHTEAYIYR